MGLDFKLLNIISDSLRSDFLDELFVFFTKLGDKGLVWIIFALIYLSIPGKREIGKVMALALIIDLLVINLVFKPLFHRPRPFMLVDRDLLIPKLYDGSFPSGHAAASFAVTFVIFAMEKNLGIKISCLVVATLISLSRIYLYVHFPSDVLGGIAIGLLIGKIALEIYLAKN